jgi:hypothetical protein
VASRSTVLDSREFAEYSRQFGVPQSRPALGDTDSIPVASFPDDDPIADFTSHGLALQQVASHGWLVRTIKPAAGPRSLLACIDENADGYEVMEMYNGFRWTTFATLREVAIHLAGKRLQRSEARGA